LDNFCRKCATGSVDFLFSKPQHSWLCEDFENKKWAEDVVQLRIRKSKLFLAESLAGSKGYKDLLTNNPAARHERGRLSVNPCNPVFAKSC
jgi:hypothetical protein